MSIISKLDYGCISCGNIRPTLLRTLDPVQNSAIRITIGALRTGPFASILYEANEPISVHRRKQLLLNYVTNLLTNKNKPTFNKLSTTINQIKCVCRNKSTIFILA